MTLYRFVPNDQSKVNGKVVPEVAINGRWEPVEPCVHGNYAPHQFSVTNEKSTTGFWMEWDGKPVGDEQK